MSQQNYTKYNLEADDLEERKLFNITGSMVILNENLPDFVYPGYELFYNFFTKSYISDEFKLHHPKMDLNSREYVVSLTKACSDKGLFGIDFYLSDLAEDVTYFTRYHNSYAFLIDFDGTTVMHPLYPRPLATTENYHKVDIKYFETVDGFDAVRTEILSRKFGNMTLNLDNDDDGYINKTITFSWSHADNFYIVVIVTIDNSQKKTTKPQIERNPYLSKDERNLLYHRIDLKSPAQFYNLCRHFRQVSTLDNGTFYLSPSAFPSPFTHLRKNQESNENVTINYIQTILAYIKDQSRLLANPGVVKEVRDDVSVLSKVMHYLKGKNLQKYYIRRYITTVNGVMLIYPGCVLDNALEPTRRNWFVKAMEHPGKIVITEPYLDSGGAGYIVTVSHTVFEGKSNALHNANTDIPVAVVSMDVPQNLFYKFMLEASGYCSEVNIKCFLMDDKGYLISHPSILKPVTINNLRRTAEHITHKESYVANDILNHKILVEKRICSNFLNRTIQRYYQFNTSLNGIITNYVPGERTKYHITSISGTNLFIGIVNSSYEDGAFCPCSRVDRLCLNCNRMEQTDCECPCECPLLLNSSSCQKRGEYYKYNDDYNPNEHEIEIPTRVCPVLLEQYVPMPQSSDQDHKLNMMNSCIHINCELYMTQFDCLGKL